MKFLRNLVLTAFALFAFTIDLAKADPALFDRNNGNGIKPGRPLTLPPQRPIQPDFNGPRHRL